MARSNHQRDPKDRCITSLPPSPLFLSLCLFVCLSSSQKRLARITLASCDGRAAELSLAWRQGQCLKQHFFNYYKKKTLYLWIFMGLFLDMFGDFNLSQNTCWCQKIGEKNMLTLHRWDDSRPSSVGTPTKLPMLHEVPSTHLILTGHPVIQNSNWCCSIDDL